MNENLQNAVATLIEKTTTGLDGATALLESELPLFIQELLMWHVVRSGLYCVFGVILFIVAHKTGSISMRSQWEEPSWNNLGLFAVCVLSAILGIVFFNIEWLHIWLAPKVWLVDYAVSLTRR